MRFIYIVTVVQILFLTQFESIAQVTQKVLINEASTFILHGSSNVNKFSCFVKDQFCGEELNVCFSQSDNSITFDDASFSVPVVGFDCGNKLISRDMHKALKANEFPLMSFKLLKIDHYNDVPVAKLLISIAGFSKLCLLTYDLSNHENDQILVNLSTTFQISDFNIEPPSALLGLLKVDETIRVDINLDLSVIE